MTEYHDVEGKLNINDEEVNVLISFDFVQGQPEYPDCPAVQPQYFVFNALIVLGNNKVIDLFTKEYDWLLNFGLHDQLESIAEEHVNKDSFERAE